MTHQGEEPLKMTNQPTTAPLVAGDHVEGAIAKLKGWYGKVIDVGSTGVTVLWIHDGAGNSRKGSQPGRFIRPDWLRKVSGV